MRHPCLVLVLLACAALAGCTQMRVTERHFIRPDPPGTVLEKRFAGEAVRDLSVVARDGVLLNGILAERPDARNTVLYFGGNMFHLDRHADTLLATLGACRTNVAVFDYRGYGRSGGAPTVENMKADALSLFDSLNARYPGRVIVHGQSLGSFMAAYVAQARPVLGTVLETTATSATELVDAKMPWYARPFVRIEMDASLRQVDNRIAASRVRSPTLVIAAGKDEMTPAWMGKAVFDAIPGRDKQLLMLEKAGHNDALRSEGAIGTYCGFVQER
ncbi:alpha/beta hydrolase [Massilia oculi]|uniref:Alpha/beta hydrolase n=1 Tax=Massilia hydrophila TaxID=3044279 RepID=A0ABS7Y8Y0_9BURK|nr:alpha/beta hydrolase [Massilia oculi]MCA1856133.1 alpha/beta hydrolase [Massilia oculi]